MYFHQGGHGGAPPLEMMNRWFTRYLLGVENGVENDPRAWIVREGDERLEPHALPDYPAPGRRARDASPDPGGEGVGTLGLGGPTPGRRAGVLFDNVNQRRALAIAERSPNPAAVPTCGAPVARARLGTPAHHDPARARASRPRTCRSGSWRCPGRRPPRQPNFSVITRGWADPKNHGRLTESEPLVPGEFYDVTFTLQPDDQVIPAGKRIGLMIFSSDREFTLWPQPGTELTVELDGTSLTLPVVGGQAHRARLRDRVRARSAVAPVVAGAGRKPPIRSCRYT
jgi:X-Pro dipeptidyl-peptidase